jgi:hypothetical protein
VLITWFSKLSPRACVFLIVLAVLTTLGAGVGLFAALGGTASAPRVAIPGGGASASSPVGLSAKVTTPTATPTASGVHRRTRTVHTGAQAGGTRSTAASISGGHDGGSMGSTGIGSDTGSSASSSAGDGGTPPPTTAVPPPVTPSAAISAAAAVDAVSPST